jgi:uncharacterized membrane protein
MKKQYYILAFVSLILFSCGKDNKFTVGDSITKKITIEFDSISKKNNDWHQFNFDKANGLEVSFSKGTVKGNSYTITAKEYSEDTEPIKVTLSSNVTGTYSFKLIYSKSSETAEVNFENGQSFEFPELVVQAKWKAFIPYITGLIILLLIIIIVLVKKHLKGKTFDDGFLQIAYPEEMQISLEGKRKLSFAKIQNNKDLTAIITCEQKSEFIEGDGDIESEENIIKVAQLEVFDDDFFKINNETIDIKTVVLNDGDTIEIFSFDNNKLVSFQYEN